MMECKTALNTLEQCFDAHSELPSEVRLHLDTCDACCVQYEKLRALECMLGDLPIVAPAGIDERIITAIAQDQNARSRPMLIAALFTCALIGMAALGWLIPTQAIQEKLRAYADHWIGDTQWLGSGVSYQEQFESTLANAQQFIDGIEWFTSSVVWSVLITTIILLLFLNGIFATQMRHTSH